jgi:hypothetical protein
MNSYIQNYYRPSSIKNTYPHSYIQNTSHNPFKYIDCSSSQPSTNTPLKYLYGSTGGAVTGSSFTSTITNIGDLVFLKCPEQTFNINGTGLILFINNFIPTNYRPKSNVECPFLLDITDFFGTQKLVVNIIIKTDGNIEINDFNIGIFTTISYKVHSQTITWLK